MKKLWLVLPLLAVVACTKWDKSPPAAVADVPPAPPAAAQTASQEYASRWCAPQKPARAEANALVMRINQTILLHAKDRPTFKDSTEECEWIAQEVIKAGSLDLSEKAVPTGIHDLAPLTVFKNLRQLSLRNNGLTVEDLQVLKALTALESLDLSENSALGAHASKLTALFPQLQSLSLEKCALSNAVELNLMALSRLKHLSLADNELEASPFSLPASLESLNLSKNRLHASLDISVRYLPALKHLNLSGNELDQVPFLPPGISDLQLGTSANLLTVDAYRNIARQKSAGHLKDLREIVLMESNEGEATNLSAELEKSGISIRIKAGGKPHEK